MSTPARFTLPPPPRTCIGDMAAGGRGTLGGTSFTVACGTGLVCCDEAVEEDGGVLLGSCCEEDRSKEGERRVRVRVGTIAVGRKDGSRVVAILSRIQIEEAESAKEARGAEHQ